VDELLDRARARGRTVFLSTHLLDRAERLDARIAIIDTGRLVAIGPIGELRQSLSPGGSLEEIFLKVTEPQFPAEDRALR
jgi:ABC-2 type transport system ATP-binding protein